MGLMRLPCTRLVRRDLMVGLWSSYRKGRMIPSTPSPYISAGFTHPTSLSTCSSTRTVKLDSAQLCICVYQYHFVRARGGGGNINAINVQQGIQQGEEIHSKSSTCETGDEEKQCEGQSARAGIQVRSRGTTNKDSEAEKGKRRKDQREN